MAGNLRNRQQIPRTADELLTFGVSPVRLRLRFMDVKFPDCVASFQHSNASRKYASDSGAFRQHIRLRPGALRSAFGGRLGVEYRERSRQNQRGTVSHCNGSKKAAKRSSGQTARIRSTSASPISAVSPRLTVY